MYSFNKQYDSTSMYIEDFLELEKIIKNHVKLNPNFKDSFKIRLITNDKDIKVNTFKKIPAAKNIVSLRVDATGWENENIIQSVYITFTKNYCGVSTKGENEIWAKGLQQKLEEFILSKKTFLNKHLSKFQMLFSLLLGGSFIIFLMKLIISLQSNIVLNTLMNGLGLFMVIFLFYLNIKIVSSHFTVISLCSKKNKSKKPISRAEWIAIIGIIIPIIIGFIF